MRYIAWPLTNKFEDKFRTFDKMQQNLIDNSFIVESPEEAYK